MENNKRLSMKIYLTNIYFEMDDSPVLFRVYEGEDKIELYNKYAIRGKVVFCHRGHIDKLIQNKGQYVNGHLILDGSTKAIFVPIEVSLEPLESFTPLINDAYHYVYKYKRRFSEIRNLEETSVEKAKRVSEIFVKLVSDVALFLKSIPEDLKGERLVVELVRLKNYLKRDCFSFYDLIILLEPLEVLLEKTREKLREEKLFLKGALGEE